MSRIYCHSECVRRDCPMFMDKAAFNRFLGGESVRLIDRSADCDRFEPFQAFPAGEAGQPVLIGLDHGRGRQASYVSRDEAGTWSEAQAVSADDEPDDLVADLVRRQDEEIEQLKLQIAVLQIAPGALPLVPASDLGLAAKESAPPTAASLRSPLPVNGVGEGVEDAPRSYQPITTEQAREERALYEAEKAAKASPLAVEAAPKKRVGRRHNVALMNILREDWASPKTNAEILERIERECNLDEPFTVKTLGVFAAGEGFKRLPKAAKVVEAKEVAPSGETTLASSPAFAGEEEEVVGPDLDRVVAILKEDWSGPKTCREVLDRVQAECPGTEDWTIAGLGDLARENGLGRKALTPVKSEPVVRQALSVRKEAAKPAPVTVTPKSGLAEKFGEQVRQLADEFLAPEEIATEINKTASRNDRLNATQVKSILLEMRRLGGAA